MHILFFSGFYDLLERALFYIYCLLSFGLPSVGLPLAKIYLSGQSMSEERRRKKDEGRKAKDKRKKEIQQRELQEMCVKKCFYRDYSNILVFSGNMNQVH